MQIARGRQRAVGVVGQQRRHLQRHPAVDAVRPLVDRSEQLRGAWVRSSSASSKNSSSPDFAEDALRAMSSS